MIRRLVDAVSVFFKKVYVGQLVVGARIAIAMDASGELIEGYNKRLQLYFNKQNYIQGGQ